MVFLACWLNRLGEGFGIREERVPIDWNIHAHAAMRKSSQDRDADSGYGLRDKPCTYKEISKTDY